MPRKGSFGEISAISAGLDKPGTPIPGSVGYIIVKTFRQIRKELDTQGKATASLTQNGVLQIFEVGSQSPVNVDLDPNSPGTANKAARVDHHHHLDEDIAPTWTSPHDWQVPTAEITPATGAIRLVCTLPATDMTGAGVPAGMRLTVTSPAGSGTPTSQSHGIAALTTGLVANYTGTASNYAVLAGNPSLGTGTSEYNNPASPGVGMNTGVYANCNGVTAGFNCGGHFQGHNGTRNYGVIGDSQQPQGSAINVGVAGFARNTSQTDSAFGVIAANLGPASAGAAISPPNWRTRYGVASALVADSGDSPGTSLIALFYRGGTGIAWQWGGDGVCTAFGSTIGAANTPLRIIANASQSADLFSAHPSTGVGTKYFAIDSAGRIDWSTVGISRSSVADGASAVAFNFQDTIGRSTGSHWLLENTSAGRQIVRIDHGGFVGFGYSATLQSGSATGSVLSFVQQDSESASGRPHSIGIKSIVAHDATTSIVVGHVGVSGQVRITQQTGVLANSVITGLMGSAFGSGANVTSSMSGRIYAGLRARISGTTAATEADAKDLAIARASTPKGNVDHCTGIWIDSYQNGTIGSYPTATDVPTRMSSMRVPIAGYAMSVTAGSPVGEGWGIYGEDTGTANANIPITQVFMRVPYPRKTSASGGTCHFSQIFFEPWPNTSTIRTRSAVDGDLYYDDGTNFEKGLWEYAGEYLKLAGLVSGKYLKLKTDGSSYTGSTPPSNYGYLICLDDSGGATSLGWASDSSSSGRLTNGALLNTAALDDVAAVFTATWDFQRITIDEIEDGGGSGNVTFFSPIALNQIESDASPGLQILSSSSHLLAFYGASPISRPTHSNQAALAGVPGTYDGTMVTISGTGDDANINNNFADIYGLLFQLRAALVNLGLIQGS